jgi:flagella basal body P-ring formation protein FlgA
MNSGSALSFRSLLALTTLLVGGTSFLWAQAPAAEVPAAPAVSSEVAGTTFTPAQLLAGLTRQLTDRYQIEGDLQLDLLRAWNAPAVTGAAPEVVVVESPTTLAPSLLVRVRLQNGTSSLGEYTVQVHCQIFRDVWITRNPVERGAPFDAGELDTRRVDVLRERDAMPAVQGDTTLRYARSISGGRLITWRDVARRALVRKGEVIDVTATDGALSITMKALAMENGSAGETVRVRNLESKKEFPVLVVSDARGQVRF